MPISRARFEQRLRPLGERIVEFLGAHSDEAWSFLEIVQNLEHLTTDVETAIFLQRGRMGDGSAPQPAIAAALEDLVKRGIIDAATDSGIVYYSLRPGAVWSPPVKPDLVE